MDADIIYKSYRKMGIPPNAAALLVLCDRLDDVGSSIRALGTGNAATDMGALEFMAVEIKDGFNTLASSITESAMLVVSESE